MKLNIQFFFVSQLQIKYKETFNAEKGHYIGSDDTPQMAHCREVSKNVSEVMHMLHSLQSILFILCTWPGFSDQIVYFLSETIQTGLG